MTGKGVLSQSIEALRRQRNFGVFFFYFVLLFFYGWALAVAVVPKVQSMIMKKFHPGTMSFGQWAACQFLPSMYSFKNEIIISPQVLPGDFQDPLPKDALKFAVNHYPLRIIYFSNVREVVYSNLPVYVYLRNSYRGRAIVSSYIIERTVVGADPILRNLYERVYR